VAVRLTPPDAILVKDQLDATQKGRGLWRPAPLVPMTRARTSSNPRASSARREHYAFDTIAALTQFYQPFRGRPRRSAGYYEVGDNGGGEFTFLGFAAARARGWCHTDQSAITVVADPAGVGKAPDGKITITAVGHGLGTTPHITSTYISGSTDFQDGV